MDFVTPLTRRSLHDELLDRLRNLIVQGDLPPASKVPEKQLCKQFGVSRTPLREALKVLAAEGLINITPNRGAIVSPIVLDGLEEALPVLASLEGLSGMLACRLMSDEQIAGVRALHDRMREAYKARDKPEYYTLNHQIHDSITAGAGNDLLMLHYSHLSHRVRRARVVAQLSDELWDKAMQEHEQIIIFLEVRDSVALGKLLKIHVLNLLSRYRYLPRFENSLNVR